MAVTMDYHKPVSVFQDGLFTPKPLQAFLGGRFFEMECLFVARTTFDVPKYGQRGTVDWAKRR